MKQVFTDKNMRNEATSTLEGRVTQVPIFLSALGISFSGVSASEIILPFARKRSGTCVTRPSNFLQNEAMRAQSAGSKFRGSRFKVMRIFPNEAITRREARLGSHRLRRFHRRRKLPNEAIPVFAPFASSGETQSGSGQSDQIRPLKCFLRNEAMRSKRRFEVRSSRFNVVENYETNPTIRKATEHCSAWFVRRAEQCSALQKKITKRTHARGVPVQGSRFAGIAKRTHYAAPGLIYIPSGLAGCHFCQFRDGPVLKYPLRETKDAL